MLRISTVSLVAAMAVALFSFSALAQTPDSGATNGHPSHFAHMLKKLDANGDGKISLDEYLAGATARFKAIDTQNTGSITAAQLAASPEAGMRGDHDVAHKMNKLDANGDGKITLDEYLAAAKARFAKLDKNGDGYLEADEMTGHHGKHGGAPAN